LVFWFFGLGVFWFFGVCLWWFFVCLVFVVVDGVEDE
jgi:hypothetical protein